MNNLRSEIQSCQKCPLHTEMPDGCSPIPGMGATNARVMLVGEAADATGAILGEPLGGIAIDMLKEALSQAKDARMTVLEKLSAAIPSPRENLSTFAPRITTIKVAKDKIKDIIGTGGRVIRKIIEDTGATIDIEDDGSVQVASIDEAAMKKAV